MIGWAPDAPDPEPDGTGGKNQGCEFDPRDFGKFQQFCRTHGVTHAVADWEPGKGPLELYGGYNGSWPRILEVSLPHDTFHQKRNENTNENTGDRYAGWYRPPSDGDPGLAFNPDSDSDTFRQRGRQSEHDSITPPPQMSSAAWNSYLNAESNWNSWLATGPETYWPEAEPLTEGRPEVRPVGAPLFSPNPIAKPYHVADNFPYRWQCIPMAPISEEKLEQLRQDFYRALRTGKVELLKDTWTKRVRRRVWQKRLRLARWLYQKLSGLMLPEEPEDPPWE